MAKLTRDLLTPEQLNLMHIIRHEYIDALTKEFDDNNVKEKVKWLYKLYGLKEPCVTILDYPQQFQLVKPVGVLSRAYYPVIDNIGKALFDLWKQLKSIDESIMTLTKNEIVGTLYHIYEDHIRFERIICNITWYSSFEMERKYSVPLLALYDYFLRIGAIIDKSENKKVEKLLEYIKTGIRHRLYITDHAYVIRNNDGPRFIDELGRLNNEKGYAIIWKARKNKNVDDDKDENNIIGYHFVKGVYFQPDLFYRIFIKEDISSKEIFDIKNTEQKAIAIHYMGYDRFIKELNARKLDEWKTKSIINGNVAVCSLYEFDLAHSRLRFVKVQDHSTGKTTVLGVPIEKGTETAKGAVAWTFGLREEEYNPEIES